MTDEKKYHLLIFFPKGEPHQYHYFSNDKYVARYVNQPKWCRGLFSTNEKEDIDNMNNFLYNVSAKLTNMKVEDIKKLNKSPFKYGGFLPQVVTNDPKQGGLPKENEIVDVNGQPI